MSRSDERAGSPGAIVGLLAVVWMIVNTQRLTASAFVGASSLMADFGITAGLAGLLVAAYFPAYGSLQLPAGMLVDRVRPRVILLCAVALVGASNLLFALAPSAEWAIVARAGVGVSSAPVFLCCLKICSELSLREYPRRIGLIVTASTVGAIFAVAGLPLLLAVLPWRTVGLLLAAELLLLVPLLALAPLPRGAVSAPTSRLELVAVARARVRTGGFWWLALPAMAWCGAYFGVMSWLPRYARDVLGSSPAQTGILPGLVQLGLLVGASLAGSLQTRWRPLGPWLFYGGGCLFALAVALLPSLHAMGATGLLYALAPAIGLLFGCFYAWMGLVTELVPRNQLGTVTGMLNGLTFVLSFVNPWLMGTIFDLVDRPAMADPTYSAAAYTAGFLFLAATMGLGLLGGALAGRARPAPTPHPAAAEAG